MAEETTKPKNGLVEYKKTQSRKWKLVLLVLLAATVGAFLPPVISAWLLKAVKPLVIITGTEWVSVVTLVVSGYFGVNAYQKHIEKKAENELVKIKNGSSKVTETVSESHVKITTPNENGES